MMICVGAYTPQALGADLMTAYHDALLNSPALRAAIAERRVKSHLTSEALAGFLPKLEAKYDQGYETSRTNLNTNLDSTLGISSSTQDHTISQDFNINLVQPIFNYKSIIDYELADQAQVIADYQLVAAEQKLMLEVAKKYFGVLTLQDKLIAADAQKKYLTTQLTFMQKKVQSGLESQLNADEVKTELGLVEANRIDLESKLRIALNELQNITGKSYSSFQHLSPKFIPTDPRPDHLDQWVEAVQKGNVDLHTQNANLVLTREKIRAAGAGGYPEVNAVAGYQSYKGLVSVLGAQQVNEINTGVGVQLKVPLFEGGYDMNKAAEAQDQLTYEYARYDELKSNIFTAAESLFGGIQALVAKVKADQSAEDNAAKSVDFASQAYQAGIRGSVDLLAAQKALYEAESNYSEDLYHYMSAALELKQLAGILSPKDLEKVNHLLKVERVVSDQFIDLR